MCTTTLSVLIKPSSPNVHTKVLHTDFHKFPHIHTIHIYILYCFLPEETFQEGYFFEKMCYTVFFKLGAVDSNTYDLEKTSTKRWGHRHCCGPACP